MLKFAVFALCLIAACISGLEWESCSDLDRDDEKLLRMLRMLI